VTREVLVGYLVRDLGATPARLTDDASLFESGMLDSFRMIDLMAFLETSGGFRMDPSEVTMENLDTIGRILAFMAKKRR
jgi:acyl carrier protein